MKLANTKRRSVNTKFWDDPYIIDLGSMEKLIFLYLILNDLNTLAGCYEITIRKISFDTGLEADIIGETLQKFENDKKIVYRDGYIILKNFLKHQLLNGNMEKNVIDTIRQLPAKIQIAYFEQISPCEGFTFFLQPLEREVININLPLKDSEINKTSLSEVEGEVEDEIEIESKVDQKKISKVKRMKMTKTSSFNLAEETRKQDLEFNQKHPFRPEGIN